MTSTRKITDTLNSVVWLKHVRTKTKIHLYETIMKTPWSTVVQCGMSAKRWRVDCYQVDFLRRIGRKTEFGRVRNKALSKHGQNCGGEYRVERNNWDGMGMSVERQTEDSSGFQCSRYRQEGEEAGQETLGQRKR